MRYRRLGNLEFACRRDLFYCIGPKQLVKDNEKESGSKRSKFKTGGQSFDDPIKTSSVGNSKTTPKVVSTSQPCY